MNQAARAFGYPFRPGAWSVWIPAVILVAVLPLGLVPLLGYTVRAVRTSSADPSASPPSFRPDGRLFADGILLLAVNAVIALPFLVAVPFVFSLFLAWRPVSAAGGLLATGYAGLATAFALLLPWAAVFLLLVPVNLAAFAGTGRPRDLLDPVAAARRVRSRPAAWNLVSVVVVTGWAIALAGTGVACLGFLPAAVYAMLVSAHAIAILVPSPAAEAGGAAP